ncbi:MAG: WcaF family extracellular polysaccharide biosynthesis acetyltransferase [Gaiellaceae bacterium]
MTAVDLTLTSNRGYTHARSVPVRLLWLAADALVMRNPLVLSYALKRALLRLFGARVGRNVIVKQSVQIKCPWHLTIGDNAWIGEHTWIDNFVDVRIGANACISQGAYLCTGNHDWSDPGMGRVVEPVVVEDGAWVGAFARVAPGVVVGREAVVTLGSVLVTNAEPGGIYAGNPAQRIRERTIRARPGAAENT